MAKYKIELIVESDNDYFGGNQIEDLKKLVRNPISFS